jgi:hypothetical protein
VQVAAALLTVAKSTKSNIGWTRFFGDKLTSDSDSVTLKIVEFTVWENGQFQPLARPPPLVMCRAQLGPKALA